MSNSASKAERFDAAAWPQFAKVLSGDHGLRKIEQNLFRNPVPTESPEVRQTRESFSAKWEMLEHGGDAFSRLLPIQRRWYLEKYGFDSESDFQRFLARCGIVVDAGTGNGAKAAWFAQLCPEALIVAIDLSDSLVAAANHYQHVPNLVFVQSDIACMDFLRDGVVDYVSCDEVIHHTRVPKDTFSELLRVLAPGGHLSCYVYRRKALPRELLDEEFRQRCRHLRSEELAQLAAEITELGRILSTVGGELEFPAVPALGIEAGRMTVQRFIYWNFMKCYWNEDIGYEGSTVVNFDWYSPAIAARFSKEEFREWFEGDHLEEVHFYTEPACYCVRLRRPSCFPS